MQLGALFLALLIAVPAFAAEKGNQWRIGNERVAHVATFPTGPGYTWVSFYDGVTEIRFMEDGRVLVGGNEASDAEIAAAMKNWAHMWRYMHGREK